MSFYKFTKSRNYIQCNLPPDANFLDFGSGWGRITRTYLRDFDLKRIFGFEPNLTYCANARMLNPYICFMNGDYLPDGTLPDKRFNVVVGWSVFSHLPPRSATEWLKEMARITLPAGHIVMTTWGLRFLNRLIDDQKAMENGAEIHWYSKICIEAIGDIGKCIDAYSQGEFVWFTEFRIGSIRTGFSRRKCIEATSSRASHPVRPCRIRYDEFGPGCIRPDTTVGMLGNRPPRSA